MTDENVIADALVSVTAFIGPDGRYISVDEHTNKHPANTIWSQENLTMSVDIEGTDMMIVCKWVDLNTFILGVAKRRYHNDAFNEAMENLNLD